MVLFPVGNTSLTNSPLMQDLLLAPLQAATSKPARRAYLQTFLLLSSAAFLLFLAASSYILFYSAIIPRIGVTKPLHFLYPYSTPPHPLSLLTPLGPSTVDTPRRPWPLSTSPPQN
jgi:hypothetical protein